MRILSKIFIIFSIIFSFFSFSASAQTTQKEYKAYNFEAYYYEDQVTVCWMFQERRGNSFIRVYSTDNFNLYSNGEKIPYRTDGKISRTKNNGGQKTYCVRYFYDDYTNNFYGKKYSNLSFKENSIFLFSNQEKIDVQIDSSAIINHNQTAREIIAYNKLRPERRKIPESDFISIPLPVVRGCTNPKATNYNPKANKDDGSCKLPIRGCTDSQAVNYNAQATEDDGSCQARVEGCTDPTASNYNANANVHMEDQCVYPPPPPPAYVPQDITGYISTEQVQSGATSWTSTVTVNMTGAILNYNKIQTWEQFTPVSATTEDNRIIITFRQFDDQRLDVECTNYEYTIPREAIATANGDKNINPITGNFTVVGCNQNTPPKNTNNEEDDKKPKHENTIKSNNFYLSLYDTDEKGKVYINLTNVIYIIGFLAFFSILFFVLFGFIKNSFLGRSKK